MLIGLCAVVEELTYVRGDDVREARISSISRTLGTWPPRAFGIFLPGASPPGKLVTVMSSAELAKRVCAKCSREMPEAMTDQREAETNNGERDNGPRPRRMLNERQVLEIVPIGRTTLYRLEKAGRFPRSIYISPNRRVWFEDEIVAWQNAVDEFDPRREHRASPSAVEGKADSH